METSAARIREAPPQPGETAPDFELPDSMGTPHRLSEFCASNPVVLLFYRGHW